MTTTRKQASLDHGTVVALMQGTQRLRDSVDECSQAYYDLTTILLGLRAQRVELERQLDR